MSDLPFPGLRISTGSANLLVSSEWAPIEPRRLTPLSLTCLAWSEIPAVEIYNALKLSPFLGGRYL